jgi:hypothetical protein
MFSSFDKKNSNKKIRELRIETYMDAKENQAVLWIQPVISMRILIRFQGAKPMRIHADRDPD